MFCFSSTLVKFLFYFLPHNIPVWQDSPSAGLSPLPSHALMLTCPRSFCGLLGSEATEPSRDIGIYRQKTQKNTKDEMPSNQNNNCTRYAAHAHKRTTKDNKSNNNSHQEQQQLEGVDENTEKNNAANSMKLLRVIFIFYVDSCFHSLTD